MRSEWTVTVIDEKAGIIGSLACVKATSAERAAVTAARKFLRDSARAKEEILTFSVEPAKPVTVTLHVREHPTSPNMLVAYSDTGSVVRVWKRPEE